MERLFGFAQGTLWGVACLDLLGRGIQLHDLACDSGAGLRAGVLEAELAIPLHPELFHVLQNAHRLTQRLEGTAHRALDNAERARRAGLDALGTLRRRGRTLKIIKVPLPQPQVEEGKTIETSDGRCWLLDEMRLALEPIASGPGFVSVEETKATVEKAAGLLKELNHPDITALADVLQDKMPELLAPLEWLEQQVTPALKELDAGGQTPVIWFLQHHQKLNLNVDTNVSEDLRPVVRTAWNILGLFHRSSSLAESLHSWLRR